MRLAHHGSYPHVLILTPILWPILGLLNVVVTVWQAKTLLGGLFIITYGLRQWLGWAPDRSENCPQCRSWNLHDKAENENAFCQDCGYAPVYPELWRRVRVARRPMDYCDCTYAERRACVKCFPESAEAPV